MACWVFSNAERAVQIQTKLFWIVDSGLSDLKRGSHKIKILHFKKYFEVVLFFFFLFIIGHRTSRGK